MSTLHKVKAYFGMAPMDDYEDDYYEDDERGPGEPRLTGPVFFEINGAVVPCRTRPMYRSSMINLPARQG